jgi:probable rRNA maturation factor
VTGIEVQVACEASDLPEAEVVRGWVTAALEPKNSDRGLLVRLVTGEEMRSLNHRFRGFDKTTNVLSFPWDPPPGVGAGQGGLGDLVVCVSVVREEARRQNKALMAHYAHMIVHGTLHLQGYDHGTADQAGRMESLETQILEDLGYADPYLVS